MNFWPWTKLCFLMIPLAWGIAELINWLGFGLLLTLALPVAFVWVCCDLRRCYVEHSKGVDG